MGAVVGDEEATEDVGVTSWRDIGGADGACSAGGEAGGDGDE